MRKFPSLDAFLQSRKLTIDGEGDDGWGAPFAVKGVELDATILFADISECSQRTADLSSSATLVFVNHFFTWISAEALKTSSAIIDKYIGDEIMLVFSEEFGAQDSFVEAIQTARMIAENDAFSFRPHIGIAKGPVTVGYVGTSLMRNCSVFGQAVSLASRCTGVKVNPRSGTSMVFPADLWGSRRLEEVFPPRLIKCPDGRLQVEPLGWKMGPRLKSPLKGIGEVELASIIKTVHHCPTESAEDRAVKTLKRLRGYAGGDDR